MMKLKKDLYQHKAGKRIDRIEQNGAMLIIFADNSEAYVKEADLVNYISGKIVICN